MGREKGVGGEGGRWGGEIGGGRERVRQTFANIHIFFFEVTE